MSIGSKEVKIAIVDDDESVRVATASLVRSLGMSTMTFASAEEFLDSSEALAAQCLIADVQMPGMSGIELQTRLLQTGRRLPIIFITAFPEERIRERAQRCGAIGFLKKPFDGDVMIDCIDRALHGAHG